MFSLSNMPGGNTVETVREWTSRSLRSAQVQVQTLWMKQHASDGSHGDVTATTVRSDAFGASRVFTYTVASLTQGVIEIPSGVSFVDIVTPFALGARFVLLGITMRGVQEGHMLWLRTGPGSSFTTTIQRRAYALGTAPINTEFIFAQHQASAADNNLFEMATAAFAGGSDDCTPWVPFIYSRYNTRYAWMLNMTLSGA